MTISKITIPVFLIGLGALQLFGCTSEIVEYHQPLRRDGRHYRMSAGSNFSLYIDNSGIIHSWGNNDDQQLGRVSMTGDSLREPPAIESIGDITSIASGKNFSLALSSSGRVFSFGANDSGQLGNDKYPSGSMLPVTVKDAGGNDIEEISFIAAGSEFGIAIAKSGYLFAWGNNSNGQLGNASTRNSEVGTTVKGEGTEDVIRNIVAVSAGSTHALAIKGDGTVVAWGNNNKKQVRNASSPNQLRPISVKKCDGKLLMNITQVAAGKEHSLALTASGELYGWGSNSFKQLGDDMRSAIPCPALIKMPSPWQKITNISAGSNYSIVILDDGRIFAWGDNSKGQLGINSIMTPVSKPTQTALSEGAVDVITGENHVLVKAISGTSYGWGDNGDGRVNGDSLTTTFISPQPLLFTTKSRISEVSSYEHTLILFDSGEVHSSGTNSSGQLGDGTITNRSKWAPVQFTDSMGIMKPLKEIKAISVGNDFSLVLSAGGYVYHFGDNTMSQSGGAAGASAYMTIVKNSVSLPGKAISIAAGGQHGFALLGSGQLYGWGDNQSGQLGVGASPAVVVRPTLVSNINGEIVHVSTAESHSLAVTSSGRLYTWGSNLYKQLGYDASPITDSQDTPALVTKNLDDQLITYAQACDFHTVALTSTGDVFTFGSNSAGQLGIGPIPGSIEPKRVMLPPLNYARTVTCGREHTLILLSTGKVLAFGRGAEGQIGRGFTWNEQIPLYVLDNRKPAAPLTNVAEIFAGRYSSLARMADGQILAWGNAKIGLFGYPSTDDQLSPSPIGR